MKLVFSYILLYTSKLKYVTSTTDHPTALKTWLRSKGGIFNSKIDIIQNDETSYPLQVSAVKNIPSNEILFRIPPSCLITGGLPKVGDEVLVSQPNSEHLGTKELEGEITFMNKDITFDLGFEEEEDQYQVDLNRISIKKTGGNLECDAVSALLDETKLGSESEYAPYINYLLESKYSKNSPRNWSDGGKELLVKILNGQFPPEDLTPWWQSDCGELIDDKLNVPITLKNIFVPFLDMLHHHGNEQGVNTRISLNADSGLTVYSSRDIQAGEEISADYSRNEEGAAEALRDYGLVQAYPQIWSFPKLGMKFEVYKSKQSLQVKWIRTGPLKAHESLKDELKRLKDADFLVKINSVPRNELVIAKRYLRVLIDAIQHAIQTKPDLVCYQQYVFDQYTELERIQTNYQLIAFSHHKEKNDVCLSLGERPGELMLQQCSSYRPHYHEMFVHYTARYLDQVKRVAWIGGGDSMLLHEIIKYPSLEFVIGLEIDQQVTRKSFQYFGTRPHWNDPKVQWWYGDAAKSLLMLPKDYFGTFDLVLVDLSETVLSMSVCNEMDILTALGLLLKPKGILVKNDVYYHSLSKVFKYSMELDYENPLPIPYVCVQPLIYGSNQIDFLTQPQQEYNVEVLWKTNIPKLNETSKDTKAFNIWYNYGKNDIEEKSCQEQAEFEREPEVQENSPGILMLLETEGVGVDLAQSEEFIKVVEETLEKEGLNVITSTIGKFNEKSQIVTLLKEGYIVARTWPTLQYCAFDIHLWSSFEKLESIKKALIAKLRSTQVQSYRIVAGGIFGISTWKEDAVRRGPRYSQTCDAGDGPLESHALQENEPENAGSAIDQILKESISSLIAKDEIRVGVVCGYDNEACSSLDIVKNHDKVSDILELRTCPNLNFASDPTSCKESILRQIEKFTELSHDLTEDEGALEVGDRVKAKLAGSGSWYFGTLHHVDENGSMDIAYDNGDVEQELESQYVKRLTKSDVLMDQRKLGVLIIDSKVSKAMGKVLHELKMQDDRGSVFSNNMLILAPIVNEDNRWKMIIIKNYYDHLAKIEEPVYMAGVMLSSNSDSSALDLLVLSTGDYSFISSLNTLTSNLNQASTDYKAEVKSLAKGDFFHDILKTFTQNYFPDDYDTVPSLAQWYSQKALGRQTIFQLAKVEMETRIVNEGDSVLTGDRVDVYDENYNAFFSGMVESVNQDGTVFVAFDDGDEDDEVRRHNMRKSFKVNEDKFLSSEEIKKAIQSVLSDKTTVESTDIGDGGVYIAQWTEGNLVALWDGRNHLDVNLFTYDQGKEFHDGFAKKLVGLLSILQVGLLDTQPRGIGGVVNFSEDIEAGSKPIWA